MKRILYSCFILLSFCFNHSLKAQSGVYGLFPNGQCASPTGVYHMTAYIVAQVPTSTSYSWSIITPTSSTCGQTVVPFSTGTLSAISSITDDAISFSLACCGNFTIVCYGWNNGNAIGQATIAPVFSNGFTTGVVYCPTGAGITPTIQSICLGNNATITASGANTYTWNTSPPSTGSVLVVSPTVNTCYTYTGTTTSGCTVTPLTSACVSVQAITLTTSPASQSMCLGSPVNFTAFANVVSNASVTPGTIITGYQWYEPSNPTPIGTGSTLTSSALSGTYNVIVTYTGAAGTCTAAAISSVVITTSIPVSLTPSSPSVCPNGAITMTAVSIQTLTATNHTWTVWDGTGTPTLSVFHNNPHLISGINPPWTVTVQVSYFGCPGTATATIGLLTLTPTLTSSAPLSCPGQSLSLTATGALSYTFTQIPPVPAPTTTIGFGTGATSATPVSIATTPTSGMFPIQYCVDSYSAGCVGSACIVVNTKILTPTLTASTRSICPNTEFTLTASGSGVYSGSTYTYSNASANIGNSNPLLYTPPLTPTLPLTYTVTVDSAGCIGQASITIYSLTLRTLISSPTPSICLGHSLTLNATGGAGTTYTFFASVPQFSNSATAYSIDAGTSSTTAHQPPSTNTLITYTVKADSVGCKGNSTFTVGILDLGPTLTLTSMPSGSICPGTSNTLDIIASGASNYTFYAPGTGSFATGTGASNSQQVVGSTNSPASIPLAGLVYTVSADSAGCVGSNTLILHERILHPNIILTPTIVCSGVPIVLTATNVGGLPSQTTYTNVNYTFGSFDPATTATAVVLGPSISYSAPASPTAPLVYSVFVDSSGCKGISPGATITIRPDLPLLPSTSAASVCPGLNATLSVVAPTTSTTYSYTWTQVSGTGSMTAPATASNVNVNPITNSTYSVHVVDPLGCVGNTVISVGIDPAISFSLSLASSGSTICLTQSVTLSASNTIAPISLGTINYTWTPNGGLAPPTVASSVLANPSVTTIYTVTADNGYGCVAQNTITVAVGTVPGTLNAVNATAPSVCVGFTSTLTASGATSYTWTGSTFTNAIAQQSVSVPSGNYTVILSNGGGCSSTAVYNVGFLPNLVPTIVSTPGSQTTCITSNNPKFSKPVHLTASGAGTYVWFPYSNMTYSLGPQTDVRPPASTQYTVIGSTAICSGSAVISINVIPQFSINVIPPLPAMCLGDSIKLSIVNIGSNAVGPVSAFTYSWSEALNAPPLSLSDYFSSTVTVYPQNTTTYTTEVRDSRDCISLPRLVTVTVLPQPLTAIAIPTINNVATNTVCFVGLNPGATDVTINLTGNNMNTGLQFGVVPTYTWLSPYAVTSILSPANNNAVTVSAPLRLLNGSSVAVYTLISGYNGVQGCKRFDTVSVRVIDCRPIMNVKFRTAEPNDTICARNCITFMSLTDTMAGGPQNYIWKFEGGAPATSTLANPTVCYNFPNSSRRYSVILQVSNPYPIINPNGGPGGSTLTFGQNMIEVVDIPNVTIVAPGQVQSDTTVRFGQSVELNGSGAHTYEWSPAYNISSLSRPNVTVNPFKTTQYILTGYNSKSCYSSDTINVIIVENCGEMYVPNAFTPNNDGANDVLYVRGICLQSLTFMIFNRWGEKIFETADQSKGWDGSYKGEDLNTGVFVYRLEGKTYDGKGFSTKGNITLIR